MKLFELFEPDLNNNPNILLEFNVVNLDDIEKEMKKYSAKVDYPEAKSWFEKQVKNYIINNPEDNKEIAAQNLERFATQPWMAKAIERGDKLYNFQMSQSTKDKLDHIADWIESFSDKNVIAFINNEFAKTPEDQKAKLQQEALLAAKRFREKLSKVTVDQAIQASKEWSTVSKRSLKKAKAVSEEGIEEYMSFPDGYSWVLLKEPQCFKREGDIMGHCVGRGGYQGANTKIYSLRDPQNGPHVTVEVTSGVVKQIKGKAENGVANPPPGPKYIPYVSPFLKQLGLKVDQYDLGRMGLIYIGGDLYNMMKLPNGLTVDGDLKLSNMLNSHDNKFTNFTFPSNLTVSGTLDISNLGFTKLASGLKVGRLIASKCVELKSLADDMIIEGEIDINGSGVEHLPAHLIVVNGPFNAQNSKLASFPSSFTVKGNCNISNIAANSLPTKTFIVHGDLDMSTNNFEFLTEGIQVSGKLNITNNKIKQFPKSYKIKGIITGIDQIPTLEALPANTSYDRIKIGSTSNITSIGENCTFDDSLLIQGDKVSELPNKLTTNRLTIMGCPRLKIVPASITTKILGLRESHVEKIGDGIKLTDLIIQYNKNLKSLPADMQVTSIMIDRPDKETLKMAEASPYKDKITLFK